MSPDRGPVPIRASLEKLLAELGSPEIDSMTMLVERWPEVVGERLAERIRASGGRVRYVEYPKEGHIGLVLALAAPLQGDIEVLDEIVAFIEALRVLGDMPTANPRPVFGGMEVGIGSG